MNHPVQPTTLFACLNCEGNLELLADHLKCTTCNSEFEINGGIPLFMPKGLRSDYALTSYHDQLNQRAIQVGWESAIRAHVAEHHDELGTEYINEYICSEARADFRFLMPTTSDSVVVDIGSGWGNITSALARSSRHVIALDTNLDNLRFVQLRASQEGLNNVTVAQADACTLPLRAESCDAALMVGVLEWVAWGRKDGEPHTWQKKALERISRALRPGGCLYLATENRFSFKYFLGAKEPHTDLRFVSILPFKFAKMYSKLARKQDYREVTYSLLELEKLLRSVGFDKIKFYFPIPGYQNFRYLLDLENRGVSRYVLDQMRGYPRFTNLLYSAGRIALNLPISFQRFLWPSFSILAVRS